MAPLNLVCVALLAWLAASVASAGEALFPRPDTLQPAIGFWTRVYTEVDSGAGFIHDSRNLDIVYETLQFKPYDSNRKQWRRIEQVLERYRVALRALAKGKRTDLTTIEQRALELWGEAATGRTLREAAENMRFQRGQADRFRAGLVRAGAWEGQIRKTLQELGLPEALAALPHVESSYHPLVQSKVGAAGLWQFTRHTGRRYLRVDHVVDERLDPRQSTEAAARLLQHNYSVLKSWPLALTAYNHGLAGVRRAVRDTGSDDIGTIVQEYDGRRFGFASRNFYASFLAALDVSSDYQQYFGELTPQPPDINPRIELPAYFPAGVLSRRLEVDAATLEALNPALQPPVWDGRKYLPKGYRLRLPVENGGEAARLLQQIAAADGHARQVPDIFYQVERGDTLSGIARRYRTSVSDLMAMNGLRSRHRIRAGQSLRVSSAAAPGMIRVAAVAPPADGEAPAAVSPVTRDAGPDEDGATNTGQVLQASAVDTPPAEPEAGLMADPADYEVAADDTIEVQAAETLGHYAEWLQTHSTRLRRLNGMRSGQSLRVGRRVKLDFSDVSAQEFERQRLAYQQAQQAQFFRDHRITGACGHTVRPGDSLWIMAARDYDIPFWLLRQYNPDVDFNGVLPKGTEVMIPLIEEVEDDAPPGMIQTTVSAGACPAVG